MTEKGVLIQKRLPDAIKPNWMYQGDAGWDLYCLEDKIVWPKSCVDLDTGWNVKIPDGHWGTIKPRSSTFKVRQLVVFEGVLDSGYTGVLSVLVWNPGFLPRRILAGDRLAQLVVIPLPKIMSMTETTYLPATHRGSRGFGSTGK